LALVLIVQGLLFGDGGLTVLGLNIFNMGVVGSFVGFYSFKWLKPMLKEIPAIFIAGFLSFFITAVVLAIELWFAGILPLIEVLYFMVIFHAIAGLVAEGLLSSIVFGAIKKIRPDLIASNSKIVEKTPQ
jgi:cobalt/nickel transport system permease protein